MIGLTRKTDWFLLFMLIVTATGVFLLGMTFQNLLVVREERRELVPDPDTGIRRAQPSRSCLYVVEKPDGTVRKAFWENGSWFDLETGPIIMPQREPPAWLLGPDGEVEVQ